MKGKILIDELKTSDENMFLDVTYNGAPFTGTAYEDSQFLHSEYNYLNGFGHGRSFSAYPNGQLQEEFFLENGEKIEETSWYQSGVKREYFKKSPFLHQFWNEKGVLMLEDNNNMSKEWYPNASLKTELFKKKEQVYYGKDEKWALKIKTKEDFVVLEKNNITFNNPYIGKHYMDLLQDYSFYKYFIIWLDDLDIIEREEVICNMIKSNVLWHKYNGINLASVRYKIHKAIPYIKLEINNHQKPPSVSSGINDIILGLNSLHFAHTIAERARLALHELEK